MENQKRFLPSGPFPIFSGKVQQSKRPRIALYTHPNNIMSQENHSDPPQIQNQPPPRPTQKQFINPSWKKPQVETNKRNHFNVKERGGATQKQYYNHTSHKETFPAAPTRSTNSKVIPQTSFQTSTPPIKPQSSLPSHHSSITPHHVVPQHTIMPPQYNSSVKIQSRQHDSQRTRPAGSQQQVTSQSNTGSSTTKPQSSFNSTRVITTTAHGIYQWTGLTTQQHVIYEIFGVVTSPVLPGEFGSKKFLIKTANGTVKCHYWEMGSQLLPPLTRGKNHRVMGTWDRKREILKCVSVRLSTLDEEKFIPQLLNISDLWLKQNTISTNEH